jgi:hypothetical protein
MESDVPEKRKQAQENQVVTPPLLATSPAKLS